MNSKIIVTIVLLFLTNSLRAQTGGPGQPEFMQFQQAGTSDLVNPATGSFSYQIPLFTIGGYSMNLTYQAGIQPEDVASMVGLGWNLNPGSIVRTLRGLPDDFENDTITKEFNIRANETYGGKIGIDLELAGLPKGMGLNVGAEFGVFYNNFKGWGIERALSGSLSVSYQSTKGVGGSASLGMGVAANSQSGCDKYISPSIGLKLGGDKGAYSISLGKTWSVNSIDGAKSSINTGLSYTRYAKNLEKGRKGFDENGKKSDKLDDQSSFSLLGYSNRSYLNNSYQPDIDYPFKNTSETYSGSIGFDAYFIDPGIRLTGYHSKQELAMNKQYFPAYGTMYESDNIPPNALMDFNREKKLPYFFGQSKILPIPYMTPDVFNLNAQGISMTFSVSKNDVGVVGDAQAIINSTGDQFGVECNLGNMFKAGLNTGTTQSYQLSEKWDTTNIKYKAGQDNVDGNLYQQFCFKNHGEINKFQNDIFSTLGNYNPIQFPVINETTISNISTNNVYNKTQPARQSTINYLTAQEASKMGFDKKIQFYHFDQPNTLISVNRTDDFRKPQHLSEMTVTRPDGMKYVFGIPVYNTLQKEVTFNVLPSDVNKYRNLVKYTELVDNSIANTNGTDYFFEATSTQPYATQFLITAVLSPDYRDISNDGITPDDIGNYVKFNYFREKFLYHWRTPFAKDSASYNMGLRSDESDDKGNYVYGEKELFYIHSMESRTEIARFYYSERKDGLGVLDENGGMSTTSILRKLDSIKIFSKPDLHLNNNNAVPIKTIYFNYDYTLCKGIDNGINGCGKLTLDSVAMAYESSKKGKYTPYTFEYGKSPDGAVNPDYNSRDVNRWGYFQKNNGFSDCDGQSPLSNIDYPYSLQNKKTMDSCAYAWNLTDITIPGGGKLKVNYEAQDYAYIQDKTAGQMFVVTGLSHNSENTFYFPYVYNPYFQYNPSKPARIYFKLINPITDITAARKDLEENYIKDIKDGNLYYKFYVKLKDYNGVQTYDYITGYAKLTAYDIEESDHNYAWIELDTIALDNEKPDDIHCNPILKTALQFMRINRNQLIFSDIQTRPRPAGISSFCEALPGVFDALSAQRVAFNIGTNKYCLTQNYCQSIVLDNSFIRLYNPIKKKIAGGARVKDISINDNWALMAGGPHQDKSYTTSYNYSTEEISPNHDTINISSGVADYEPMIGGDEISLKQPIFYSDIKKKAPDNDFYVEVPVNESLHPAPQIIYGKVTQITNKTDDNVAKTGKIINEYYTAKDYPVKVHMTDIDEKRDKTNFNAFQLPIVAIDQQHDFATLSQGYSIELNNMSGLPKATWVYNENGDRISGEVSEYFPNNDNFTTIDKTGKIHNNMQLGLSAEFTIDGRRSYDKSVTVVKQANFNLAMVSVFPLGVLVPLFSKMTEEKQFQSIVTNKVIHRNALLKSKTVYSQSASVTTENLAFDEITGEALLTLTKNEFDDSLYSFKYPAWWMYDGMGPSYVNTKYKFNSTNLNNSDPMFTGLFLKMGDEIRAANGDRLWVKIVNPTIFEDSLAVANLVSNVNYQVYTSGAKNLLSESAGQVVTWNYNPLLLVDTIGFDKTRILNSSTIEYYDDAVMYCDSCRKTLLGRTEFLLGKKGNWKPKRTWFYLDERTAPVSLPETTDIRTQGLFKDYSTFWILPKVHHTAWEPNYSGWEWKERVNLTDVDGQTIETEDRIGRRVANLIGYQNTLITAQAYNSSYNEAYSESFEDCHLTYCLGDDAINVLKFMKRLKVKDGTGSISNLNSHTGKYSLRISDYLTLTVVPSDTCPKPDVNCKDCIGGFYPQGNKEYIFSCWVKVDKNPPILSCNEAKVIIKEDGSTLATLNSEGPVIEDWQRIMGKFKTNSTIGYLTFTLQGVGSPDTYFDDIRILPADGNMVSYVYDDFNLRLKYILDENNYFTKYEYNNQGELIRIKKESERGILTVKEGYQALTKKKW